MAIDDGHECNDLDEVHTCIPSGLFFFRSRSWPYHISARFEEFGGKTALRGKSKVRIKRTRSMILPIKPKREISTSIYIHRSRYQKLLFYLILSSFYGVCKPFPYSRVLQIRLPRFQSLPWACSQRTSQPLNSSPSPSPSPQPQPPPHSATFPQAHPTTVPPETRPSPKTPHTCPPPPP